MRKVCIVFLSFTVFMACNNGSESSEPKTDASSAETSSVTDNPDYKKGLALVAKNDCLTCHSVGDKVNGPAYREIANKYADAPDTIVSHLANKIIAGGTGVWGEVPMTAHPNLSKEDAEAMVKYVLLLKK